VARDRGSGSFELNPNPPDLEDYSTGRLCSFEQKRFFLLRNPPQNLLPLICISYGDKQMLRAFFTVTCPAMRHQGTAILARAIVGLA